MTVNSPVRRWRVEHHISQKDLAHEMGIFQSTPSQKEHGTLNWQFNDLLFFRDQGLTSDFVLGFDGRLPSS
ncbi:helix-turn-helix domain-containing protein [Bifidobacterium bombi]|uniref:helix-turn-helix domain-containing protein n=1 Tax=Bifidobacterium bombi TaxID=471511 RepID=UPI0009DD8773|nr:helix-turn-helix domain-containing protein [Bifidobacterium bombi]